MSLRDDILGFDDLVVDTVVIPEWGDMKLELRSATAGERAELMRDFVGEDGEVDHSRMQAAAVVMTACDPESGEKLFTQEDIDALLGKNASAVQRIFEAAAPLMGLAGDQVDEGKADSSGDQT